MIATGNAIVGPDDGQPVPDNVCLACLPEWRDLNDTALAEYYCQLEKEQAIADSDFERARWLLRQQGELRTRLCAMRGK